MATVRSGVMKAEVLDASYKGEVVYEDADAFVAAEDKLVEVIHRQVEKRKTTSRVRPSLWLEVMAWVPKRILTCSAN